MKTDDFILAFRKEGHIWGRGNGICAEINRKSPSSGSSSFLRLTDSFLGGQRSLMLMAPTES